MSAPRLRLLPAAIALGLAGALVATLPAAACGTSTRAAAGGAGSSPLHMGTLGGPPKAVAQPNGAEDVFWRGTDNHLWHASFVPGRGWTGGQNLGGDLASDPAPAASGPGNVHVFWQGTDGSLWHAYYRSGHGWAGAENLGGDLYPIP